MAEPTIINQFARALKQFIYMHCKSSDLSKLNPFQRIMYSGIGSIVYFAMLFNVGSQDIAKQIYGIMAILLHGTPSSDAAINDFVRFMFIISFVVMFSFIIGYSRENGTRMQFFFFGFIMSASLINTILIQQHIL